MLVLVVLMVRLGADPFLDGLQMTSAWSLAAATAITALSTACCAWRWRLVAAALGAEVRPGTALGAVYRAEFLNATLPGGVLGDVDRAVRHGRGRRAIGAGIRSVVWERTLGQTVQGALTVVIVLVLPSPMQSAGAATVLAVVAVLAGAAVAAPALVAGSHLAARALRSVAADLRSITHASDARVGIVVASAVAACCHLAVFLLAAHVTGVGVPAYRLLPIAAVVLLASALPVNVAGWGPREGVAAWAFATAGLGGALGVTTAVVYGVMALVATLPGAVLMLVGGRSTQVAGAHTRTDTGQEEAAHA